MNEARAPAADGMIIRRACPECGAPIRHAEGDGAAACRYCGLRFALARPQAVCPAFLLPPRAARTGLAVEAKRTLRRAGTRLHALSPPRLFFAPFYRLRADTWLCYRDPPPPSPPGAGPAPPAGRWWSRSWLPASAEGEVRFHVGSRDLTLDAGPRIEPWRRSLGLRVQTCEALPLSDCPEVEALPIGIPPAEAQARLRAQLESAARREVAGDEPRLFAPQPRLMVVFAPAFVLPFHDGTEGRGVILDGLSGRSEAILTAAEHRRLLALLSSPQEARAPSAEAARATPALLPLVCPECSAPMPFLPRAQLHACPVCQRLWSAGSDRLRAEPIRLLRPASRPRRDGNLGRERTWLPFHRLRGGGEALFAPAFQGRYPRAVWNFTFSLNRRRATWNVEAGEGFRPGATVEQAADSALALAPFLSFCLEREVPFAPQASELVWIEFEARGPDWVEPSLGLGFPRAAVTPWAPPAPRAAAARTG